MPILILLTLLTFPLFAKENWRSFYLERLCTLYDQSGKQVFQFPGQACLYFPDGRLISASKDGLRLFDKNRSVQWHVKEHFHHQINLTSDGRVLMLSSNLVAGIRQDKLLILSLAGKILAELTTEQIFKQTKQSSLRRYYPITVLDQKTTLEMSHFNSFYEIPDVSGENLPAYLKRGNFILNGKLTGIYVLSPDLKQVLHHQMLPSSQQHNTHDVQVLSNGRLQYFNNMHRDATPTGKFSTVEEFDLVTQKVVFELRARPATLFFSNACGGVQKLDEDHFLYSDFMNGTYIYSKSKENNVLSVTTTHVAENNEGSTVQQVKAIDVKKFLSHWK